MNEKEINKDENLSEQSETENAVAEQVSAEVSENSENVSAVEAEKPAKKKFRLKPWWQSLTKKKRRLTIGIASATLAVMLVVIVCCSLFIQPIYNVDLQAIMKDENLVWSDEFNGDALNTDVWRVEAGPRRGGYWKEEQAIVEDGKLKIRTEKVGDEYWMSGLVSNGGMDYKYGYIEASIKLPKAQGIWSAFWTMPTDGFNNIKDASVNGAEIDIMEAPCYPAQHVQQAVHVGGYGEKTHTSTFWPGWISYDAGHIYDAFHTYGLYWDENIYKFYIDGKCIWTTHYNHNVSKVFQYLYLSVETGGKIDENGKAIPGASPWSFVGGKPIEECDSMFPADFEIDYVRLWKINSTELRIKGQQIL